MGGLVSRASPCRTRRLPGLQAASKSKQVDVLFVQNAKNVTINKDKLVLRGVNTRDARDELRRSVANGVALLWPEENTASTGLKAVEGAALVLGLLVGSAKSSFDEVNLNAMDKRVSVEKFITISTPWGGHAAAKFGIRALKYPAPAWIDMAPGSAFLKALWREPLPPESRHSLMFGY